MRDLPDAVFCALLGHRPSPKRTPWGLQQRIAALKLKGIVDDDGGLWHRTLDELDACAAAYAAYALAAGLGLVGRRPGRGRDRAARSPGCSSATRSCRRRPAPRSPSGSRPAYTGTRCRRSRNGRIDRSRYAARAARAARQAARLLHRARCRRATTCPSCSELLRTAGVAVVGELVQHREQPHPNLYLGPGKVEELKPLLKAADANLVVADDELTPRQERNLEKELGCR